MKDVAFGQYYPVDSFVHRMDPRAKIILLVAFIVMVFVSKTFAGFALAGGFLLVCVFAARLPLGKVLKSVRAVIFILVLTFIINALFHRADGAKVLFSWWKIVVTDKALIFAAFMAIRILLLVLMSCVLTLTTTPVSLTDGVESLLKPLALIKFPVHELALVMSIALRFIPTLTDETARIVGAQKARGADFDSRNLGRRIKAVIPVIIPLLISALRRAEELGDAMDARCYSAVKKRTKYKKLRMGARDIFSALVLAAVFAGVILFNIYGVRVA